MMLPSGRLDYSLRVAYLAFGSVTSFFGIKVRGFAFFLKRQDESAPKIFFKV